MIAKLAKLEEKKHPGDRIGEIEGKGEDQRQKRNKEKSKVRHICNQQETCGHAYTYIRTHAHISTSICKMHSAIHP